MVQEKYGVQQSTQEKGRLRQMIRAGRSSARAITRARILLKTDQGWTASQVAAALDSSERTVFRAKRRYAEEGLDEVLRRRNQGNRYRKLDDRAEASVDATASSFLRLPRYLFEYQPQPELPARIAFPIDSVARTSAGNCRMSWQTALHIATDSRVNRMIDETPSELTRFHPRRRSDAKSRRSSASRASGHSDLDHLRYCTTAAAAHARG